MFRVVKYGAPWCSACKELERRFERTDIDCEVVHKSCDDDEVQNDCAILGIRNLPTTILYRNDEEMKRWTGVFDPKVINETIENLK